MFKSRKNRTPQTKYLAAEDYEYCLDRYLHFLFLRHGLPAGAGLFNALRTLDRMWQRPTALRVVRCCGKQA